MMLRPLALATACLLTTSCIAPPPFDVQRGELTARAHSHVAAEFIANEAEIWSGLLREHLPTSRGGPLELWQHDEIPIGIFGFDEPDFLAGYAPKNRVIVVRDSDERLAHTIGHEMVHATLDESWSTLPAFLEEGLADALPDSIRPLNSGTQLSRRMLLIFYALDELSVELEDTVIGISFTAKATLNEERPSLREFADKASFRALRGFQLSYGYSVGMFLTQRILDRIGLDGLHAMCLAASEAGHATIPLDEVLAAAGVSDDPSTWLAHVPPLEDNDLEGEALELFVGLIEESNQLLVNYMTSQDNLVIRFGDLDQSFAVDKDLLRSELIAAGRLAP